MSYFVITLLLLAVAIWAVGRFANANTSLLAQRLPLWGGIAALGVAAVLAFRGGISTAMPLAAFGVWLLSTGKGASWWRKLPGGGASGASQRSTVRTEHLEMELDHTSGTMRGRVLKGFFAGRSLDRLRPVELAHLWQDCRFVDPQSAQLIEAYLDRRHPTWREDLARAEAETPKGPDGRMTRAEALEILGLAPEATADEIRDAHKKLMLKLHPDRGGSNYLAAKINEAKAVALGE